MATLGRFLEWLLGASTEATFKECHAGQANIPSQGKMPAAVSRDARSLGEFNRKLSVGTNHKYAFIRDENYESSPGVKEALAAINGGAPTVLVLGRAGTGKTRLIQYLKKLPGGELQATVAPTGLAAINAQAQTIHSLFRFPHVILDAKNLPWGQNFGVLYHRMKRLIIDEISMVRADLIDAIDARLRIIRKVDRPFGGVQVVLVGDFLQLPPVVADGAWPLLHQLGYKTPYAFSARALQELPIKPVVLEKVFRQDEREFIDILGRIRVGQAIEDAVDFLNRSCHRQHREGIEPLLLTPTRAAAQRYNRDGLRRLDTERTAFRARVQGNFPLQNRASLPAPELLELAVGARVMAVKNDMQGRWVNGSLGTVKRIVSNGAFVLFDRTREKHLVSYATWEKIQQRWNATGGRIENTPVGTYQQIPLIHAWAITIHKAQGLTLDDVRIDLGSGAFAPGQVYVALSRVRTMAGLSFARPLLPGNVQADPMLLAFMSWLQSNEMVFERP